MREKSGLPELQPRLRFNAAKRLDWDVLIRVLYRGASLLGGVLELVMTADHVHQIPTIGFQQPDDLR